MRRRALLLALLLFFLVASAAAAGASVLGAGGGTTPGPDQPPAHASALGHHVLADLPTPATALRLRDTLERDRDARRDIAVLATALVLSLVAGWLLSERAARICHAPPLPNRRTRAPPRHPAIVHC